MFDSVQVAPAPADFMMTLRSPFPVTPSRVWERQSAT
jgi:hypothetical protein